MKNPKNKPRTRHLSGWASIKVVSADTTRLTLIDRRGKLNVEFELEAWQWANLAHDWLLGYAKASQDKKDWLDRQLTIAKGGVN